MQPKLFQRITFLSGLFLLLGCKQDAAIHPTIYHVEEVFKTGPTVVVRSLAADNNKKQLWVGTSAGANQVNYLTGDLIATYNRDNGLANEYVFGLHVAADESIWFGTNAGGVSVLRDGKFKTYFPLHGLADYWVYTFAEQADGNMWIGTWAGANLMDPVTEKFDTYVKEIINEWVYAIDIDESGVIWFGTEGGVSRFDGENWQEWSHQQGIGANNIDNLPVSKNSGLGTRTRHDLGILAGGRPTYNPSYVFSLVVDKNDQTIWVGTWGGGVSHFDGKQWSSYTTNDGLAGNIVYSILQASDGSFWFGTNAGINHFDGVNWQTLQVHQSDVGGDVYALTETLDGVIWAGSRGAVSKLTPIGSSSN